MISPYKQKRVEERKKKVVRLYKAGLSIREIAPIVEMSRGWVHLVIVEKLGKVSKMDLTKVDRA